jgi:hypothetical protein
MNVRSQVLWVVGLLVIALMLGGCETGRDNGTGDASDMGKPNAGNAPPEDTTSK